MEEFQNSNELERQTLFELATQPSFGTIGLAALESSMVATTRLVEAGILPSLTLVSDTPSLPRASNSKQDAVLEDLVARASGANSNNPEDWARTKTERPAVERMARLVESHLRDSNGMLSAADIESLRTRMASRLAGDSPSRDADFLQRVAAEANELMRGSGYRMQAHLREGRPVVEFSRRVAGVAADGEPKGVESKTESWRPILQLSRTSATSLSPDWPQPAGEPPVPRR